MSVTNKEKNFISAVVYLHNDGAQAVRFFKALNAVLDQHFEQYELVAVDDACADDTIPTLRDWAKALEKPLTILHLSLHQGRETAMNAGLLLAVAMCKPQVAFVFLFPLLCKKHWKAITVTSGTVLGSWLLAAILTESSPISMLTDIMDQGLSYNTSYYGLFNFLLGFGISTKVVLLLDVAVGGVILLAAAAWMFRKKLDNDWLLWYAVTAVVSVMWFYKQSHDYIILALPAIAIFCLPHISLPAWGSILILLVDVIAFAVPKVCTLLCGLPKDVVSPWAKLLETVAIMATLYYVFQSAKRHAVALQQASQNG